MIKDAEFWIKNLNLKEHPEGGYFSETYRACETIHPDCLPERYSSKHSFSTLIYFLLKSGQISHFHRLKSDEIWHFYEGCPIMIYYLSENGKMTEAILGRDYDKGHLLQVIMPANNWFAAYPVEQNSFSLVGCTVAPGFEYEDFELAEKNKLISQFPQYKEIIDKYSY